MVDGVITMQPRPTGMAVTHLQDIESSFEFFIPDDIQKIILDCSNLEGRCVFGDTHQTHFMLLTTKNRHVNSFKFMFTVNTSSFPMF